jgi:CheY-like chemotaxis protein
VLVADDNADAAQSLVMLLRLRGHEAHQARDGIEAVEAAARLQPDVILLDLSMPGLSGYEAARKIREQQGERRPRLVALSGWGQVEHRRRSAEAGFDAHVAKPAKGPALFEAIEQARPR